MINVLIVTLKSVRGVFSTLCRDYSNQAQLGRVCSRKVVISFMLVLEENVFQNVSFFHWCEFLCLFLHCTNLNAFNDSTNAILVSKRGPAFSLPEIKDI